MKRMRYLMAMLTCILIISACSKDDNTPDCEFIGKWCTPSALNPNECSGLFGTYMEFRANGDLLLLNTGTQKWESTDCKTIKVINKGTGLVAAEYEVLYIDANNMTIDIGTTVKLIREK